MIELIITGDTVDLIDLRIDTKMIFMHDILVTNNYN